MPISTNKILPNNKSRHWLVWYYQLAMQLQEPRKWLRNKLVNRRTVIMVGLVIGGFLMYKIIYDEQFNFNAINSFKFSVADNYTEIENADIAITNNDQLTTRLLVEKVIRAKAESTVLQLQEVTLLLSLPERELVITAPLGTLDIVNNDLILSNGVLVREQPDSELRLQQLQLNPKNQQLLLQQVQSFKFGPLQGSGDSIVIDQAKKQVNSSGKIRLEFLLPSSGITP